MHGVAQVAEQLAVLRRIAWGSGVALKPEAVRSAQHLRDPIIGPVREASGVEQAGAGRAVQRDLAGDEEVAGITISMA